jgi:ribosome maturation factor RimP
LVDGPRLSAEYDPGGTSQPHPEAAVSSAAAAQVRSAIEPVLAAAGFHLEDVEVRQAGSRRLVQVLVDRDSGVSLDDVADASRAISAVLDEVDVLPGAYVLEVSSPGVDRPLTELRHWRRNVGRKVAVTPLEGKAFTGRVRSVADDGAVLEVNGVERLVDLDSVRKAVVEVEFKRVADAAAADGADQVADDELDELDLDEADDVPGGGDR